MNSTTTVIESKLKAKMQPWSAANTLTWLVLVWLSLKKPVHGCFLAFTLDLIMSLSRVKVSYA